MRRLRQGVVGGLAAVWVYAALMWAVYAYQRHGDWHFQSRHPAQVTLQTRETLASGTEPLFLLERAPQKTVSVPLLVETSEGKVVFRVSADGSIWLRGKKVGSDRELAALLAQDPMLLPVNLTRPYYIRGRFGLRRSYDSAGRESESETKLQVAVSLEEDGEVPSKDETESRERTPERYAAVP